MRYLKSIFIRKNKDEKVNVCVVDTLKKSVRINIF